MNDPITAGPSEPGLDAALATLRGLLTSGETLEAWAVQHRLFALTHRRACIAATSGRFISLQRRLLGGYESADIRWQDLKETRISAGILAADLTLVAQASSDLNIGSEVNRVWTFAGLRKDQAQAMYRICQQHDQVWREKRRIRELEELRAKSGGVQIGGGQGGLRAARIPPARNRSRRGGCGRRAKCSTPNSSATQSSNPSRPKSSPVCSGRRRQSALLTQQMGEVAVAQPIERIGPLAQRAKQLHPFTEGLRNVLGLQGTGLIERGRAAQAATRNR